MSSQIVYNNSKVNAALEQYNELFLEVENLSETLRGTLNRLVNARGFNEYISDMSDDAFEPYISDCDASLKYVIEGIRFLQTEVLLYNDDRNEIKQFLSTLSLDEINNSSIELQDAYSKLKKESSNFFENLGCTVFVGFASAIEGVLDFGETLVDLGDLTLTGAKSVFTSVYDLCTGKLGEEDSVTNKLFEDCKARVSEKHVEGIFNSFYSDTELGYSLKNQSMFFDEVRGISSGIAQTAGIVSLGLLTGGASVAAGGLSAGRLALTAGIVSMSSNTEDAWNNGASVSEGLLRGAAGAVWDGAQWFVGAKIGAAGGYGDKLARSLFKSTSKGVVAASRIGLDAVDSAAEGFVQPFLDLIYKDSYINENGEEVIFSSDMSFADRYREVFDDAGGMNNVLVQGLIGAGGSAIGEAFDLTKMLKEEKGVTNKSLDPSTKTNATSATMDLDSSEIFESKGNLIDSLNTKAVDGFDVSKPDLPDGVILTTNAVASDLVDDVVNVKNVDSSIGISKEIDSKVIIDGEKKVRLSTDNGQSASIGKIGGVGESDLVFKATDADSQVLDYISDDGVVFGNDYLNADADTAYTNVIVPKDTLLKTLTDNQREQFNTINKTLLDETKRSGTVRNSTISRLFKDADPKVIAAYIETNVDIPEVSNQLVSSINVENVSKVVDYVVQTPTSMAVVGLLKPAHVVSCLNDFSTSSTKFKNFTAQLSDVQLGKTIDRLSSLSSSSNGNIHSTSGTLKQLLAETGSNKLQRLINNSYVKSPEICALRDRFGGIKNTASSSAYKMSVSDLDNYGRLSTETKHLISTLDEGRAASLIESSFGLNKPSGILEIIDSVDQKKLPEIIKRLENSPYETMVIERLKGSQVNTVINGLRGNDLSNFVSKLSDTQINYALKNISVSRKNLSYQTMELLLSKADSGMIDNLIRNGYLNKYFDSMNLSQVRGSVLDNYSIYNVVDGKVVNGSLLTSDGFKKVQSLCLSLKNRTSINSTLSATDNKTISALLKACSETRSDVNTIFDNLDAHKTSGVFRNIVNSDSNLAARLVGQISPTKYADFVQKLIYGGRTIDCKSVELVLQNVSSDNLQQLIKTRVLDEYVRRMNPSQISGSVLSDNIKCLFDNDVSPYKKYVLFSREQLDYSRKLHAEFDASLRSGKFTKQAVSLIRNADENVLFDFLDKAVALQQSNPRLPSQIISFLDSTKATNVVKNLVDFDVLGAKKVISSFNTNQLSSLLQEFQYAGNPRYYDTVLKSISSVQLDAVVKSMPDNYQVIGPLIRDNHLNTVLRARNVILDDNKLRVFIAKSDNNNLARTLNLLSESKLRDGKALANKLLHSVEPSRVHSMIQNGSLRYNITFDEGVRNGIADQINASRVKFFDDMFIGNETFGVDQGVNSKLVIYDVKGEWLDDRDAFAKFLTYEKGFSPQNVSSTIDVFTGSKRLSKKDYEIIKEFLISESSNSPDRLLDINRTYFERKTASVYDSVVDKLTASGVSKVDVVKMIDCFNNSKNGACSYAYVANIIVDNYKDNPQAFERDFGFSLFCERGGKRTINSLELMVDLYTTINTDSFGGKLFTTNANGSIVPINQKIDVSKQVYMSSSAGIRADLVDRYLKSKNPNLSFRTNTAVFNYFDSSKTISPAISDLKLKISTALQEGQSVSLSVFQQSNREINFMVNDNGYMKKFISTSNWNEGGGHAIYVVGMTDEHIIVSTWGKKMYLPFKEFYDNRFTVNISKIGGI